MFDYIGPGVATGITQAIGYHWCDRGLYFSSCNGRRFFDRRNFFLDGAIFTRKNILTPFSGLNQSIVYKIFSGGSYFVFQDITDKYITDKKFFIGLIAGSANAITINPFSIVKYHCWNIKKESLPNISYVKKNGGVQIYERIKEPILNLHFIKTLSHMYKNGGILIFTRGMPITLMREVTYCSFYEIFRNKDSTKFGQNICAGIGAAIIASPLNYIRNIKYYTDLHVRALFGPKILINLFEEAIQTGKKESSYRSKIGAGFSVINKKLCLTSGVFRVGLGTCTGQFFYNFFKKKTNHYKE